MHRLYSHINQKAILALHHLYQECQPCKRIGKDVQVNGETDIPLRELGLSDAAYFSPDEDPVKVAALIAGHFRSSSTARLSMRARASFGWEVIYQQHIAPLL
jgi:hypothetical protein